MTTMTEQQAREAAADALLTPSRSAANAIHSLTKDVAIDEAGTTGVDFSALVSNLDAANSAVADGDLRCVEEILLGQAHVLQSVSMIYTQKMTSAEYTEHIEVFSRIALRAANQCRQTLATLVELKNPKRAMFIKQYNQQINQGGVQSEIQKKSDNSSNELEELANEQLDPRAAQAPCSVNQEMGTVEKVHRTSNG